MLFLSGPDTKLGVAFVLDGRIGAGLHQMEQAIERREKEGYGIAANWYRLFLCEIYLEIIMGNGDASLGVMLLNIKVLGISSCSGPSGSRRLSRMCAPPQTMISTVTTSRGSI